MNLIKKNKNLILLIVTLSLSSLFSFNNIAQVNNISKDSDLQIRSSTTVIPFKVGVVYLPTNIDPIDTWDTDVINQVVEGLYALNFSDPDLEIIPNLASDYGIWNAGADEYTVPLRTGVKFHDGTDFNATAVVAHWDRMAWALNTTGTNILSITTVYELYTFPNGTPIVNNVVDNGDNTVTFFLNGPYAPFDALLTIIASGIQSPTYIASLSNTYIDAATGDIVGTGPFVFDSYVVGVELLLYAFEDYWKGNASINELVFIEISDTNARNVALLAGDIHFLSDPSESYYGILNSTAGLTFEEGPQSALIQYLGMNNNLINVTFRKAISYALDYDYIINNMRGGNSVKAKSPIPLGIRYANTTFDVPILNLTHARLIMQSMGYGLGFNVSNDIEWVNQESVSPFAIFKYTYNLGNTFREDLLVLLQDNLSKIGIRVTDDGMTWGEFIERLFEFGGFTRDDLELFFLSWVPDYNDPSTYINNMFTNRSNAYNFAQYNGYQAAIDAGDDANDLNYNVQLLMEVALTETDPAKRERLYDKIQELLIERDYPWVWGFVNKYYYAHNVNLTGFQPNALKKLDFYSCQWGYYVITDSLSITAPNNTSIWETGTSQSITWTSTGTISDVKIELYENDAFVMEIVASTPNDGDYSWTIFSGLANASQYQILVSDVSNPATDNFSDYFWILNSIETFPLSPVFNGMYVNYTFSQDLYYAMTNFSYSHLSGSLFNQTWNIGEALETTWLVNTQTRNMSGGSAFSDGTHDPVWIFTFASLSDIIPISVDGIGDHLFEVTSELIYDLPGFGLVEVWVLEDLTYSGGIAWYEKSTGILLNGTFFYNLTGIDYNYTFNFIDTNVLFTYYTEPPSLTITTPISTSIWKTSTFPSITWTSTGSITNVKIELYENDVFVMEIVASTPNDGEYSWIIFSGLTNSTLYQIKIIDAANPATNDLSDYFEIFTPMLTTSDSPVFDGMYVNYTFSQDPEIYISNISYSHFSGNLFNQTWNVGGFFNNTWSVNIQTRIMSGMSVFGDGNHDPIWIYTNTSLSDIIPIAVDGDGDHLFEVSSELLYDLPGFGLVEVWVLEDLTFPEGNAWYEKSTGILLNGTFFYDGGGIYNYTFNFIDTNVQFTYYGTPSLTITAPASFSSWETDTSQYIYWTSTGTIPDVKIELYENDVFVLEIVANTVNNGEHFWTIPSSLADSTLYQIKITDAANPATDDLSDYFEIFNPPVIDSLTVTYPDSLTAWEMGTSHAITWFSTGSITNVKIELYKDDVFELEIIASTSNDGSYTWTIPTDLEDGIDYQIRISDVSNPTTYDDSPNFAITSIPIPPGIPGYNLYLLIGIICVASGILVKNRKKLRKT